MALTQVRTFRKSWMQCRVSLVGWAGDRVCPSTRNFTRSTPLPKKQEGLASPIQVKAATKSSRCPQAGVGGGNRPSAAGGSPHEMDAAIPWCLLWSVHVDIRGSGRSSREGIQVDGAWSQGHGNICLLDLFPKPESRIYWCRLSSWA